MPLSDIRVLDIATMLAGPYIATNLADFGAEVIKIEHPDRLDSTRALGFKKNDSELIWKWLSRNKKTMTLNLKEVKGKEVFKKLVESSDIIVENFRPGTLEKWGLGYESLHDINPKIILVRVTGFGQYGPYSKRAGFGTIAEAMSGFAHITGYPDGPPTLPPFGLADSITALYGSYAAMLALYYRDYFNKEGQIIDLSIYESMFSILGSQATDYDQLGVIPERTGNRVPFSAPRNLYKTKDDKYVVLSGSAQSIAERIFKVIGKEELLADPRFSTNKARVENVEVVDQIIGNWMKKHTQNEVIDQFNEFEAAIGPVYDIQDIFQDPQFIARETITSVKDDQLGEVKMQNIVPRLSQTPGRINFAGRKPSEFNNVILKELGYSVAEIKEMEEKNVIGKHIQ